MSKWLKHLAHLSDLDKCRYTVYGCLSFLYMAPVFESAGIFPAHPYTAFVTVIGLYFLTKLGKLPEYSRTMKIDTLTGLFNREGFIENASKLLQAQIRQGSPSPVVLIVLDIVRFSKLNSSIGNALGDKLLMGMADRLRQLAGAHAVSRIGSDEFALVLTGASIGYKTFCDRLLEEFKTPITLDDDLETTIGLSIGIAISTQHGSDAVTLLRNAGIALTNSKRLRQPCVYDPTSDASSPDKVSLTSDLKSGIENNEFVFHYQPQLCLKSGRISGAEALIRWKHPVRGMLRPDEFIPLAEQSNQIMNLTLWTLREGINKLAEFRRLGLEITLSINISPHALVDSDILPAIAKEIMYNDIPYNSLTVEITESSIDRSPAELSKIIACLEMLGICISIDDFGTGHASFLYLKHMPIKEIKIDRAFITNMLGCDSDESIVRSTIELGHGLRCAVVAEGVETADQLDRLRELDCDLAQGYLVAKPLTESDFIEFLKDKNGSTVNHS